MRLIATLLLGLGLGLAGPAFAQSDVEARLRDSLRRATADLRSVQDSQARLQAEATQARAEKDAAERRLREVEARLAAAEAAPRGPTPEQLAEAGAIRAAAQALSTENAALSGAIAQWQSAYQEAVSVARQKEAERAGFQSALAAARTAIDAAETKNIALVDTATDILKLYETREFRSLLTASREPVLGLWRVKVENIVQEYEDRIYQGRFHRSAQPLPAPPTVTPLPPAARSRP